MKATGHETAVLLPGLVTCCGLWVSQLCLAACHSRLAGQAQSAEAAPHLAGAGAGKVAAFVGNGPKSHNSVEL
jgi:hypothetical protein